LEIAMNYRWMLPAAGALGFVILMAMAKDSGPWPVYIALALAAVICAGWAMLLHHRGKPPRVELTRPPPGR
jgi:hypothetical protein